MSSQFSESLCSDQTYSNHSWRCLPQPETKRRGEGILRMEDAGDFGRRRRHRQSGFQHTDRPRPCSPELFNKDHNAGRESLSNLIFNQILPLGYRICNGMWQIGSPWLFAGDESFAFFQFTRIGSWAAGNGIVIRGCVFTEPRALWRRLLVTFITLLKGRGCEISYPHPRPPLHAANLNKLNINTRQGARGEGQGIIKLTNILLFSLWSV